MKFFGMLDSPYTVKILYIFLAGKVEVRPNDVLTYN